MLKEDMGYIDDPKNRLVAKASKEIIPSLVAGIGCISIGVLILVNGSFKNGVKSYDHCVYSMLDELGKLN